METVSENIDRSVYEKGMLDFRNAIISFTQAHSALLAFATDFNLRMILANFSDLQSEIAKVDSVSGKINEISFMSKILSLNASIEAARSGTAGKGFAVVAEEFRNVTNRTTQFNKEVEAINQQLLHKADHSKKILDKASGVLTDFYEKTKQEASILSNFIVIEESDFIITTFAMRLENHARFLRNLIATTDRSVPVVDHHQCAMGKWYDANKEKYQHIPEFVNLDLPHEMFHKNAKTFMETSDVNYLLNLVSVSHEILYGFIGLVNAYEKFLAS